MHHREYKSPHRSCSWQQFDYAHKLIMVWRGQGNQPEEIYKPKEHGGLKKDGTEDKRTNPQHGFGGKPFTLPYTVIIR